MGSDLPRAQRSAKGVGTSAQPRESSAIRSTPKSFSTAQRRSASSILTELAEADRNRLQDLLIVSQAESQWRIRRVAVAGNEFSDASYDAAIARITWFVAKPKAPSASAVGSTIRKWAQTKPSDSLRPLRRGAQRRSGGLSAKWKIVAVWMAVIVVVDQLTKIIVDRTMSLHHSIPIIDGLFSLTYMRNTGAAFGIFAGSHEVFRLPFLIVVSLVAIGFIFVMLRRLRGQENGLDNRARVYSRRRHRQSDRPRYLRRSDRFSRCLLVELSLAGIQYRRSFITIGVGMTIYCLYKHQGEIRSRTSNSPLFQDSRSLIGSTLQAAWQP